MAVARPGGKQKGVSGEGFLGGGGRCAYGLEGVRRRIG